MAAGTGTQKELRVQIMDLQPGDLPAVRALELECFSDAWSEKLLQKSDRARKLLADLWRTANGDHDSCVSSGKHRRCES